MARHVTRVADGYVDIYARMPDNAAFDSDEEENGVENQVEHQVDHGHHQVQDQVEHQVEHQVDHGHHQVQKLPVVRAPIKGKGKENIKSSAHEEEDCGESSDSDYDGVHEVDSEDSSADDDEAICYRQQALELKNRVRRKMLGEDEVKTTKVPEEFIVPENMKLDQDDGSECFNSEDELSYDEDSDGEGNVRTRRTKHRVYDENADVKEFELGQVFHDSREFKQAVVNYGLKHSHHLLFPKDERNRVSAICSWPSCKWRIYGSLVPNRSQWFTVGVYNNVHTCLPIRNNRLVTSTVIAEKYFREIKDNPGWKIEKMQEAVLEECEKIKYLPSFTVNLERQTCSCRYWDLSGLPCCHAISAIYTVHKDLDDFIAPCYRIDVYDQEGLRQREEGKSRRSLKATNCQEKAAFKDAQCVAPKTITKESAMVIQML
ncbi:uncharacterized protein LOC124695405 [Lolium rigidum]|uniref:uncharacterized protein LOC124695405 n=1 Tax=Lolium rigidum TaxID=89674 RepID=UPI001F5CC6F3|nr:uncharacterized protein LOC124695405 [Lolium rigidum]